MYKTNIQTSPPSIRFTIILAMALFIPFGIKLMITEIYPSVIMPSGSGSVDITNDDFTFTSYQVYGVKPDGAREMLNLTDLIAPAHDQYAYSIFKNGFGLSEAPRKAIKLRGTEWLIAEYLMRGATEDNQNQWKHEFKEKFNQRYIKLSLEKVEVRGDLKTKEWIEEVIDEQIEIIL